MERITVILNASSGSSAATDVSRPIVDAFAAFSVTPRIAVVHPGSDVRHVATAALADGCDVLVAAGGDGTIRIVAEAVAGSGVALGVIPSGTFNHFAKDLGIPLDVSEAVAAIMSGRTLEVDAGEVNGRLFVNNASVGTYPRMVRQREAMRAAGGSKWAAMVAATWNAFARPSGMRVRVTSADRSFACKAPFVFVGNNDYEDGEGSAGSRSRLDAHTLSVYVMRSVSRRALLGAAFQGLLGRAREHPSIEAFHTQEVRLDIVRRSFAQVALDGEVMPLSTPLRFIMRPGALIVRT